MKKVFSVLFIMVSLLKHHGQEKTSGVIYKTDGSCNGYVLFAPMNKNTTYLIDKNGTIVNTWSATAGPERSVYLLPDGSLLRATGKNLSGNFVPGGGSIEKYSWQNKLLWSYTLSNASEFRHHDFCLMPNGNVLMMLWQKKTREQAIAAGRNPATFGAGLWDEKIVELKPFGKDSAQIVWEWHLWDHLVQDFDSLKAGFASISQNPQLVNINYQSANYPLNNNSEDWLHFNSLDYDPVLDQVLISCRNFNELYVIDHSTTTREAASHQGGRSGKGGDLLYRWGNQAVYGRGGSADQKLYGQHQAQWIRPGLIDAGKIIVFNNGNGRPDSAYSSIEVIHPPASPAGSYTLGPKQAFGPELPDWIYTGTPATGFYSPGLGGVQRLPNGNTLICEGTKGKFFEVDQTKSIVWVYKIGDVDGPPRPVETAPVLVPVFKCAFYAADDRAIKRKRSAANTRPAKANK